MAEGSGDDADDKDASKKKKEETPPGGGAAPAPTAGAMFAAGVERIRKTSEWIVGVFGAAGAVLIGTAPFTGLGDLVGTSELWVAYTAALLGLIGVLMVIVAASSVMLPESATASDLQDGNADVPERTQKRFETPPNPANWMWYSCDPLRRISFGGPYTAERWDFFGGTANSLSDLQARLGWARSKVVAARKDRECYVRESLPDRPPAQPTPTQDTSAAVLTLADRRVKEAEAEFAELWTALSNLEAFCCYEEVRHRFRKAVVYMVTGAALAAIGAGVYFSMVTTDTEKAEEGADEVEAEEPAADDDTEAPPQPWLGTLSFTEAGMTFAQALGCVEGDPAAQIPVFVETGSGTESAPWKVTTLWGSACEAASFEVTQDYAAVVAVDQRPVASPGPGAAGPRPLGDAEPFAASVFDSQLARPRLKWLPVAILATMCLLGLLGIRRAYKTLHVDRSSS